MTTVNLPTGAALREYEGWCLELVDTLLGQHPTGHMLYVDLPDHPRWKYHAAMVLDGIVYDAWHPSVRKGPEEYVREVFGEGVKWEIDPGSEDAPAEAEGAGVGRL